MKTAVKIMIPIGKENTLYTEKKGSHLVFLLSSGYL